MTIDLSISEIAAIVDALKWNVAKQSWLKQAWKDPTARHGHALRQEQAEHVLLRMEAALKLAAG